MMKKLSLRKQRFMQFSSLEHEGEYYMTPRDFLFSVMFEHMERTERRLKMTEDRRGLASPLQPEQRSQALLRPERRSQTLLLRPERRSQALLLRPDQRPGSRVPEENWCRQPGEGRRKTLVKRLTKKDIEDVLAAIQTTHCGSTFFRDLGDKGLISYTEYLFLLTILTKPHTGFHVAFKMLDADGNEMVEKKEFFKLQKIISKEDDLKTIPNETKCQEPEVKEPEINTTLQIRFFGKRGERKLHYREFRRFMENLQTEVQEMEFLQFSKGLSFMRKEDFAEWLLFFTNTENKDIYWKNVREKLSAGESISLDEFKSFCHFTTHLEDFSIAMQMFNLAHRPVRLAEFKRAVKVATGQELSNNILDTVFKIFDLDGDECLSHGEFLGVLKNRMHRGLWVPQQLSVQEYWKCVKKESIKGVKEVWKQAGKGLF
ncbi:EF-hand domain-containing family member A1 [Myotis brandtii]|uniref:EF-hand domain-containing family member A1 n=1 Tax=Myotis brandtii TaxID=109478 RepID=S7Q5Y9_MYOBR|nr:EF-hand domain-containing family member A1 [Myotis brandtii]